MRQRLKIVVDGSKKQATTCRHRLPQVREMTSDLCGMKGQSIPVYGCAIHGECTHGVACRFQDPNVRVCLVCEDGPWSF